MKASSFSSYLNKILSFIEILSSFSSLPSAGIEFSYKEMLMGGAAIDAVGAPLPEETLDAARQSDAVLLGAIGGFVICLLGLG